MLLYITWFKISLLFEKNALKSLQRTFEILSTKNKNPFKFVPETFRTSYKMKLVWKMKKCGYETNSDSDL